MEFCMPIVGSNSIAWSIPKSGTSKEAIEDVNDPPNCDTFAGTEMPPPLSSREIECLEWLARGLQDNQIAGRMTLSKSTIRLHLKNARVKLKAKTREQALVRALQQLLITP